MTHNGTRPHRWKSSGGSPGRRTGAHRMKRFKLWDIQNSKRVTTNIRRTDVWNVTKNVAVCKKFAVIKKKYIRTLNVKNKTKQNYQFMEKTNCKMTLDCREWNLSMLHSGHIKNAGHICIVCSHVRRHDIRIFLKYCFWFSFENKLSERSCCSVAPPRSDISSDESKF